MEIIELTANAQAQAKALLGKEEEPKDGLRVSIIGGGCSGLRYDFSFSDATEKDMVHEYENGLKVLVDQKSALYLTGTRLEFHNDLMRSGFEVVNPNATSTCGCGESFS